MGMVKEFLLAHGEKIVFAVVAVFALWGILSNLMGGGYGVDLQPEEVRGQLSRITRHMKRTEAQQEPEPVYQAAEQVRAILNSYTMEIWQSDGWDGSVYTAPPPPYNPPVIIPPSERKAPPAENIPRIDAPRQMQARVGGQRIAIAFQAGELTQWCEELRAAVWRKRVGEGRAEADWEAVRARQMRRKRTGPVPAGEEEEPVVEDGGGLLGRMIDESDEETEPGEQMESEEVERSTETLSPQEVEERFLAALKDREAARREDVEALVDPASVRPAAWGAPIARELEGTARKPDLDALLSGEQSVAATPGYEPGDGVSRMWFSFVDEDIEENAVYRYRAVLYAVPKPLPDDVVLDEEGERKRAYDYYHPFLRMGHARRAILTDEFREQLAEQREFYLENATSVARPLEFPPLQRVKEIREDPEGNMVDWWDLPEDTPEERWQQLSEGPAFGQFAWSEFLLTPVRTRMTFSSVAMTVVFMEVTVATELGEAVSERFQVRQPELPPEAAEMEFKPDDREQLLDMYPPDEVQATPIGEVRRVGGVEYDFRTGWGLVDIRKCTTLVKQYRMVPRHREDGSPVRDEDGNPVMQKEYTTQRTLDANFLVLRELDVPDDRPPRFRTLLRPAGRNEEVEVVDWNPGE